MAFKIEVIGLKEFENALAKAPGFTKKALKQAMVRSVADIAETAREKAPTGVSSPGLHRAIRTKATFDKGEVFILRSVRHGPFVEFGTKPHFPPPAALEKWARIKLGSPNPSATAFLIARKISRTGTKAQPFMTPAIEQNQRRVVKHFVQALGQVITFLAKR